VRTKGSDSEPDTREHLRSWRASGRGFRGCVRGWPLSMLLDESGTGRPGRQLWRTPARPAFQTRRVIFPKADSRTSRIVGSSYLQTQVSWSRATSPSSFHTPPIRETQARTAIHIVAESALTHHTRDSADRYRAHYVPEEQRRRRICPQ
jgi:hypothetical protein